MPVADRHVTYRQFHTSSVFPVPVKNRTCLAPCWTIRRWTCQLVRSRVSRATLGHRDSHVPGRKKLRERVRYKISSPSPSTRNFESFSAHTSGTWNPGMTTVTRVTSKSLTKRLRRALQLRRTRGLSRVAYAVLRRACTPPVLRYCLGVCATDLWRLPLRAGGAARTTSLFTVRVAESDDLPALEDYFGDPPRIAARLARRDMCVLALSQDQIAAAVWFSTGPNEIAEDWKEMGCSFRYPMNVAWVYDGKGTKIGAGAP